MSQLKSANMLDSHILVPAVGAAFKKLDPRSLIRNPVMFVVAVVSSLTTILFVRDLVTGGGNLDPKKDKHMHGATLKLIDAYHIEVEGTGWEDGAPAKEMCGVMKLVRKK